MTFDQRAVAASIAQREDSQARKEFDSELFSLQLEVSNLLKQKDQQMKLIETTGCMTGPNFKDYMDTLQTLDSDIKNAKNEIEQLKSQKRSPNPIVSSLLESLSEPLLEPTKHRRTASTGGESRSATPSAEVEFLHRSPANLSALSDESAQDEQQEV
jgi:hypothetical protein